MEAFMWRHSRQTATFLGLLPEIGELQAIHASFSFNLTDPANIRLSASLDGGSLMDVGCYCVSGSRLLAGEEPDRVYGEAITNADGVDTRFSGTLHFPSGPGRHLRHRLHERARVARGDRVDGVDPGR